MGIMRPTRAAIAALAFMFAAVPTLAFGGTTALVILHDRYSQPDTLGTLAGSLSSAGYRVSVPEMCWSDRRRMDDDLATCLVALDKVVETLRRNGASAVFIGGHGFGANAALAYAARRTVEGAFAISMSHYPDMLAQRPDIAASLEEALGALRTPRAEQASTFADVDGRRPVPIRTTPRIYASYFDPAGLTNVQENAARLEAPMLWVAGASDTTQRGRAYGFQQLRNPRSAYVVVNGDGRTALGSSSGAVMDWLRTLGR